MNRLIVACASALFLVACTAESTKTPDGTPPAENSTAATAQVKMELGKTV